MPFVISIVLFLFTGIVVLGAIAFLIMEGLDKVESIKQRVPWLGRFIEKRESFNVLFFLCIVLLVGNGYELVIKEVPEIPDPPKVALPVPPAPKLTLKTPPPPRIVTELIMSPSILPTLKPEMLNGLLVNEASSLRDLSRIYMYQDHVLSEVFFDRYISPPSHTLPEEQRQSIRDEGKFDRDQLHKQYLFDLTESVKLAGSLRDEKIKRLRSATGYILRERDNIMAGWVAKSTTGQIGDDFPVVEFADYLQGLANIQNEK